MTSKGRNGAHTHPERWKRGLEHHTHLRPETLKRGTENHNAKVTDDVVRDIRHLRNIEKWELKRLAAHFDMSISQVQKIAARTVWKHVD
jgi:AraC-like DNA-binding protein